MAQAIWFASPFGLRIQGNNTMTFSSLIQQWMQRNDNYYPVSLGLMAICWAIWKIRNEKVFENKQNTVHGALKIAMSWFNLYYNPVTANELEEDDTTTNVSNDDNLTWKAPNSPFIKINVDATWKNGSFANTRVGRAENSLLAEDDGFLLAAELADHLGLHDIIIEEDCQIVVRCLTGSMKKTPWRLWKFQDDFKELITKFNNSKIRHVTEKRNFVAHSLAGYAFSHNVQTIWTNKQMPADIAALCLEDAI
ncbi:uncharacterized protein LOC113351408 [Papaver somniferum]|uniref:uncharacterized protein LOC113351408 n=1 Tax=Papaver somniferum TaxID=3469 RepID=UPI000E6FF118|nr:uncharacterized protein LOC113351408 [Papaver somniferum]